jgi:hypothetical protein
VRRLGRISSPDGGGKPAEGQRPPVKIQKVETESFTFELLQCKLSGSSVICDLRITSNGRDRNLQIDYARMFDEHGNQTQARQFRLANKIGSMYVESLLVSSVPTPGRLTFEEVSPQPTKITLLVVGYHNINVQFRDICLTASCDSNLTPPSQTPPGRKNQKK